MTTNLLYIGKSKSFLTQFGKLEDVQLIYAKDHKDAITIEGGCGKHHSFQEKILSGLCSAGHRRLKKRRKRCVSEKRNQ